MCGGAIPSGFDRVLLQGEAAAVEHCRLAVDVKRNNIVAELRRRLGICVGPDDEMQFGAAVARILFDADHRLHAFEQLRMGGAQRCPALVQGLDGRGGAEIDAVRLSKRTARVGQRLFGRYW